MSLSNLNYQTVEKKKKGIFSGVIFLLLVFICLLVGMVSFLSPFAFKLKNIYQDSKQGLTLLQQGVADVQTKDFFSAATNFASAQKLFLKSYTDFQIFNQIEIFNKNTFVFNNRLAINNSLFALEKISGSLTEVIANYAHLLNLVSAHSDVKFGELDENVKKEILAGLETNQPILQKALDSLNISALALNQIPTKELLPVFSVNLPKAIANIEQAKNLLEANATFMSLAPYVLGYPKEKLYLFVFQNNTELRPTGGFIGTYGIVKIKNAQITELFTDDIYNLDFSVNEAAWPYQAPLPLREYLYINKWFMRDANWSPDFFESAVQLEKFYQLETDKKVNFDGVIAITPKVIEELIDYFHGLEVKGVLYNKNNFVDLLEYQVEKEYVLKGLKESERKNIIADITGALMDKIKNVSYSEMLQIGTIVYQALQEKDILIYDKNPLFLELLKKQAWTGQIRESSGDYLFIVDANLASLKTDAVMDKKATYVVKRLDNGKLMADLYLRYYNGGDFSWKTTRYNTYTRIYVPQGSKLLAANGFDKNYSRFAKEPIKVSEEFSKTVFAFFATIEPQQEKILHLQYELPNILSNESYYLLVQKQPGNNLKLQVDLNFSQDIKNFIPTEPAALLDPQTLRYSLPLNTDKEFNIYLKK